MKTLVARVLMIAIALAVAVPAAAEELKDYRVNDVTLDAMEKHFRFFIKIDPEGDEPLRFLYADRQQRVHVYAAKDQRAELEWQALNLAGHVSGLLVRDVNKDGEKAIVVSTKSGQLVAYDLGSYERVFENFQEPFDRINALAIENIDDSDPQDEIILLGVRSGERDPYLWIFDGVSGAVKHQSLETFVATEMLLANVDDDPQQEIIMNTGVIYDTRFYRVEPSKLNEGTFGERMRLLDINGDGIPEVFGELPGFQIRVYDIYAQRDLF